MAHYIFLAIAAVLMFVVFILQSSSFVWVYALTWMFSGSVYMMLITALFFGAIMFLLISLLSFIRRINTLEFKKNFKISKIFIGNTIPKQ
ncbi:MAG: hypothetical protein COY68_04980 [Candidatus Levybacteria bacterium CG_4_10_14_0_8_um_filter_35_23]|nr:MAG: hypothetical protein COY68_04980 [Candidatus Levybacteria bacterium CG_4_10_14_0_8_um_filter_35_23]